MIDIDYIVWDFDGVINRNFVDGRFIWLDNLERDQGVPVQSFRTFIFGDKFVDVICGRKDLREHINDWIAFSNFKGSADAILNYWFESDALTDGHILSIMSEVERFGVKNVIATNNESRRTAYIEKQMGFCKKVDTIFSSGRMGCMKPDKIFFEHVANQLDVPCRSLLLVDDNSNNVTAAARLGWRTHLFETSAYGLLRKTLDLESFI